MTDILGYEFETDEELQELLDDGDLVQINDLEDEELYDKIIESAEEQQMADIIYYMMDEEGSLKSTLDRMGMTEEFDGEIYIDGNYFN